MAIYEIKNLGAKSFFKLFGSLFLVVGLVSGLFVGLFKTNPVPHEFASIVPALGGLKGGLITGLILGAVYGVLGGLVYAFTALVYNFFAFIIGGIEIDLQEKEQ